MRMKMRTRFLLSAIAWMGVASVPSLLHAQAPAPGTVMNQGQMKSAKIPDLSGDWVADPKRGGIGQSLSAADPGGHMKGKEPDIAYQPWSLEKTMSEVSSTAPGGDYAKTTDPQVKFCDPPGVGKILMWPAKSYILQTPNIVYILYEFGPFWRPVFMNRKHPDDADSTWWGDSVGWYENGDTLVVDTNGFNGKTWLDQMGHPTTEKLHTVERYKRIDADSMELEITIDDPGAYNKPWTTHRYYKISTTGSFYGWVCTIQDEQHFYENLGAPAFTDPTKVPKPAAPVTH
jgi:hypothetical protein